MMFLSDIRHSRCPLVFKLSVVYFVLEVICSIYTLEIIGQVIKFLV